MEIDRILLHLSEMLLARGDDIAEFVEHADAVQRQRYYSEVIELSTNRTTVLFALGKEVMATLLKKTLKDLDEPEALIERFGTPNFILVAQEPLSSGNNTAMQVRDKRLQAHGGMFQVFLTKELAYNPSKHELVPRHEKLAEDEAREIMERYLIKNRTKMPIISRTDIMARWLGLRQGDIVRITRYNDTSGEYYYYRCCL